MWFKRSSTDAKYLISNYTDDSNRALVQFGGANNFRSIVDLEQLKVPNIGPQRRNATKIRIEDQQLGGRMLTPETRVAASEFDLSPLDSNKVGIYFSPTEVINEDIILSVADLDYDDFIGDPRDKYKRRYRQLEDIANTYWQKYNTPNIFCDYIRLIRYIIYIRYYVY